jgi:hypothetical protein
MFVAGCKKMRKKYLRNVAKLPAAFEEMASSSVSKAATQFTVLLDKLAGEGGGDWADAGLQESVQERLQKTIKEWEMDWQLPKLDGAGFNPEKYEIPRDLEKGPEAVFIKREPGLEDNEGGAFDEQMMEE